jgi:hypothetical protein
MEHRWGQRIVTDVPVSLVGSRAAIGVGRILNVSTTGALLRTGLPLPLLSLVYLKPAATLSYLGQIGRLIGCIVRHGASEIGIEWCDADSDAVLQLLTALRGESALAARKSRSASRVTAGTLRA